MKRTVIAGLFSVLAGAGWAGGLSEPIVTPDVVVDATVDSAGNDNWVGVLLTFITIGLALGK